MRVIMADVDEENLGAHAARLRNQGADIHAVAVPSVIPTPWTASAVLPSNALGLSTWS